MKKTAFIGLAILQFCLLTMFMANQFGVSPLWASKSDETISADAQKPQDMSEEEWEKMKAKKPLPFDKGPSLIDISGYPKDMQDIYNNVFTKKCSKCHTIARPINAPYALPDEWNRYIKKMMKKPGSGITPQVAKQVASFLIYDSSVRKKDLLEKKLKEAGQQKK